MEFQLFHFRARASKGREQNERVRARPRNNKHGMKCGWSSLAGTHSTRLVLAVRTADVCARKAHFASLLGIRDTPRRRDHLLAAAAPEEQGTVRQFTRDAPVSAGD
jgi:hypothetical protein